MLKSKLTRKNSRFCFKTATAVALLLGWAAPVCGEGDSPADSTAADTAVTLDTLTPSPPVDTLLFVPNSDISFSRDVTNPTDFEQHLYQQPTVALFKSMLVPGLGQLGNRRYFKALLFAGLESWFIGSAVHYGRQAVDARQVFENSSDASVRLEYYNLFDNKRKNRNKFAWFAGLTIFISMFDAYVDAHLSGSPADPRNDDFTINLAPVQDGGLTARLSYHF